MENKQLIVLGMHRSGTSMVAGMLHHLGIFMGDDLIGSNKYNLAGYYEDRLFQSINENIFTATDSSWEFPPSVYKIKDIWNEINKSDRVDKHNLEQRRLSTLKRMMEAVSLRNSTNKIWGFKDPRTVITLEAWMPLLSEPKLIAIYRNFDSVVRSLYNREINTKHRHNSLEISQSITQTYFFRLRNILSVHKDHFIMRYEYVLDNPELVTMRLADYLGVPWKQEAASFINPELRTY